MARSDELAGALDHPIFFTLAITLAVVGWMSLLTWGFKAAHLPGPAGLVQHP